LLNLGDEDAPTVCYARVSSHDQKEDLQRQQEMLETYCAAKGWGREVIADLGSGMNYRKKGLNRLLEIITVFSARLYGSRSHKNKRFLEKLNEAVTELD
jgi:predicted site-specific integrase-resolvase